MPQINLKNCTLYIVDGKAASADYVEVPIGEGNVTWDISKNIEYTLEKGNLANGKARLGDDVPLSVSFDIRFDEWRTDGGVIESPVDGLLRQGGAAAWTSADADLCTPYAVDLWLVRDLGTCFTDGGGANKYETYLFPTFRIESLGGDVNGGTISASGTCQATSPTVTRAAVNPTTLVPFAAA